MVKHQCGRGGGGRSAALRGAGGVPRGCRAPPSRSFPQIKDVVSDLVPPPPKLISTLECPPFVFLQPSIRFHTRRFASLGSPPLFSLADSAAVSFSRRQVRFRKFTPDSILSYAGAVRRKSPFSCPNPMPFRLFTLLVPLFSLLQQTPDHKSNWSRD